MEHRQNINVKKRRSLLVTCFEIPAGLLSEVHNSDGSRYYTFRYLDAYFANPSKVPIAFTLPKTQQEYTSSHLFPFFSGLLPEGELRKYYCKNGKIEDKDDYGLLLYANAGTAGGLDFMEVPE